MHVIKDLEGLPYHTSGPSASWQNRKRASDREQCNGGFRAEKPVLTSGDTSDPGFRYRALSTVALPSTHREATSWADGQPKGQSALQDGRVKVRPIIAPLHFARKSGRNSGRKRQNIGNPWETRIS